MTSMNEEEFKRLADLGLSGTEHLELDEKEAIAKIRFQKEAEKFNKNPNSDNWRYLIAAMCARQQIDNLKRG